MRLDNLINIKQRPFFIVLEIFILVLLIWSVWPSPLKQTTASMAKINQILDQSPSCNLLGVLLQSTYDLTYIEMIGYKESGWLNIEIIPQEKQILEEDPQCRIVIETFLDLRDFNLNPGSRILEPFKGKNRQIIRYQYTLDRMPKPRDGNLWVYAQISQSDGGDPVRLPLFAFPVSIKQKEIFGVAPVTVREITIPLLMILVTYQLLIKKVK